MDVIVSSARAFLSLLGLDQCSDSILSLNFSDVDCVKLTISKGLSMGIIAGAVLVKVPQIAKIINSSSVQGISLSSHLLETLAIIIGLAYNFRAGNPFTTYGEGAFIVIQNVVIMMMILGYSGRSTTSTALLAGLLSIVYTLLNPSQVSDSLLDSLQVGTIFIGILSKLPQGQLSIVTTFLQFIGTVARVGTTVQEVDDAKLLAGVVSSCVLNGIILMQIVLFAKNKPHAKKKKQ
ncbi:hypothetical protein HDV03_005316 [Kappamyces sp. JEL0829]|nr:hypothetical protein HDV03_005316 [Kappamyces sp. JEL0829]